MGHQLKRLHSPVLRIKRMDFSITNRQWMKPLNDFFRLYCINLPDKLPKSDLRLSLYTLFSTYGPVLDVVALKTAKTRGQAHVVYRDIQASTQALRALQGFEFFGKAMVGRLRFLDPLQER
jgi:RNA recognition motif-containing protein